MMTEPQATALAVGGAVYFLVAVFVGIWAHERVWRIQTSTRSAACLAGVLAGVLCPLFLLAAPYGVWRAGKWTVEATRELYRTFVPVKEKPVALPKAQVRR